MVLVGVIYYNFFYDSYGSSTSTPARKAAPQADLASSDEASAPRSPSSRGRVEEFLPALHKKHGDKAEPPPTDPTLRLDLLAKLNEVPPAGSGRDLFNFGKADPVKLAGTEPSRECPAVDSDRAALHAAQAPARGGAAAPPPPISLKYYGICTTRADGQKTAFFMDGDDILIEAEGATFKGRYRLVRIGVNSAVV